MSCFSVVTHNFAAWQLICVLCFVVNTALVLIDEDSGWTGWASKQSEDGKSWSSKWTETWSDRSEESLGSLGFVCGDPAIRLET